MRAIKTLIISSLVLASLPAIASRMDIGLDAQMMASAQWDAAQSAQREANAAQLEATSESFGSESFWQKEQLAMEKQNTANDLMFGPP